MGGPGCSGEGTTPGAVAGESPGGAVTGTLGSLAMGSLIVVTWVDDSGALRRMRGVAVILHTCPRRSRPSPRNREVACWSPGSRRASVREAPGPAKGVTPTAAQKKFGLSGIFLGRFFPLPRSPGRKGRNERPTAQGRREERGSHEQVRDRNGGGPGPDGWHQQRRVGDRIQARVLLRDEAVLPVQEGRQLQERDGVPDRREGVRRVGDQV